MGGWRIDAVCLQMEISSTNSLIYIQMSSQPVPINAPCKPDSLFPGKGWLNSSTFTSVSQINHGPELKIDINSYINPNILFVSEIQE